MSKVLLFLLLPLIFAVSVFAQDINGERVVQVKGDYVVEMIYDATEEDLIARQAITYIFTLLDKVTLEPVRHDSLFVVFSKENTGERVVFARLNSDIVSEGSRITTALPVKGNYQVELEFLDEGGEIFVEAGFGINVHPAKFLARYTQEVLVAVSAVLGALFYSLISRAALKKATRKKGK